MEKNQPAVQDAGNTGSIPGSGRSPGEGNGNPLQYSCLENPHGQRSLVGYSPWGCKELNMTDTAPYRHIGQWNRIKSSEIEIHTHTYGELIFN